MIIIVILFVCSFATFLMFGVDKHRAKKHQWRIPEASLLLCSVLGGIGGLLGMMFFHHKTRKWKFRILVPLFAIIDALVIAFLIWASVYYHAGEEALEAMKNSDVVTVKQTGSGWLFDGPSEEEALIFYPGAKVEETAYAPLLHELAAEEMDVYLMKMPLHLAFFGINKAAPVIREGGYDRCYVGGHSLGGAMVAFYAAGHEEEIDGAILLAAYPTKKTHADTVIIYGTEDHVLNLSRVEEAENLVTGVYREYTISGGNHAQFGDYGEQAGDGKANITAQEQRKQTIEAIREFLLSIRQNS